MTHYTWMPHPFFLTYRANFQCRSTAIRVLEALGLAARMLGGKFCSLPLQRTGICASNNKARIESPDSPSRQFYIKALVFFVRRAVLPAPRATASPTPVWIRRHPASSAEPCRHHHRTRPFSSPPRPPLRAVRVHTRFADERPKRDIEQEQTCEVRELRPCSSQLLPFRHQCREAKKKRN